jgi:histidine ammonia-lyase
VSERLSRTTILMKLLTLRRNTGITGQTYQHILDLWNEGLIPTPPKRGTVGASGDLPPLGHMALPLLGLVEVWTNSKRVPSDMVKSCFAWAPLRLEHFPGWCTA